MFDEGEGGGPRSADESVATPAVSVPGTYNLRDVGGLPAAGGRIRRGRLIRSDALHRLDDEGRAALCSLDVAVVVDLRDDYELAQAPNALDGVGARAEHHPILGNTPADVLKMVTLEEIYETVVRSRGPQMVGALRVIADAGDRAALVHCTAGKDRTGIVVALALTVAGVPRDEIVADYALTEANLSGEWLESMLAFLSRFPIPADFDVSRILVGSPASLLEATLAEIDADFGSVPGYLRQHGMTDAELDRLRDRLVETD